VETRGSPRAGNFPSPGEALGPLTPAVRENLHSCEIPARTSPARARALTILHPVHAIDPVRFAHYMWPVSPSWLTATPGRGAYLKARAFLALLAAEGLAQVLADSNGYALTPEGDRLATLLGDLSDYAETGS